ncbi:MAG: SUMF1/EgtB/PvdO family nonheme iron enzyme [Pirellulales bacterium]|nr:SUMF1/EgtB/PvdO family nonheme iron enzyme [Pirellulales bacterium]
MKPQQFFGGSNSANFANVIGALSDVGAYVDSLSPYGTFDQGGNVWEWNEALFDGKPGGEYRGTLGGAWQSSASVLAASHRDSGNPTGANNVVGFRVATIAIVPEPSSVVILAVGSFAFMLTVGRRTPLCR